MNCVTIKWTPVINAEGYYIYRMNSQKKWVKIANVKGGNVTSYTDKSVENGKAYSYTAKAYFKNVTGAYSSKGSDITYVETPYAFVTQQSPGGLKIIYSDIDGANKYKIYRKVKGDAKWSSLGYSATNSYVDKTVVDGKTYVYTVRAIAGKSYSSYRNNAIVCKYVKPTTDTNQSQLNRRG
jgi:fibronectin type 3 domain-containing protein